MELRRSRLRRACVGAALALSTVPFCRLSAQVCQSPRVAIWAGIRDSLWPRLAHRDGDEAWAHLDSSQLPGASATWCSPLANGAAARTAGRAIYAQHCAGCHGDEGRGDGPGAGVERPEPVDFTRAAFAGMRLPPGPAVVYSIITRGIGGTAMPGFGEALGPWERLAVMAYIGELPGRSAIEASRAWADTLRARQRP